MYTATVFHQYRFILHLTDIWTERQTEGQLDGQGDSYIPSKTLVAVEIIKRKQYDKGGLPQILQLFSRLVQDVEHLVECVVERYSSVSLCGSWTLPWTVISLL